MKSTFKKIWANDLLVGDVRTRRFVNSLFVARSKRCFDALASALINNNIHEFNVSTFSDEMQIVSTIKLFNIQAGEFQNDIYFSGFYIFFYFF